MPSASLRDPTGLESEPLYVRFRIPGAKIPGTDAPVPDLLARSYFQNFQMNMREKINRLKTRGGWVEEHWPPEVDIIAAQGATGMFFIRGLNPKESSVSQASMGTFEALRTLEDEAALAKEKRTRTDFGSGGIDQGLASGNQVVFRRLTNASINLEALIHFYKNNGASWQPIGSRTPGKAAEVRDIEMYYMKSLFLGYFTDFTVTHTDADPHRFTYNFTFKVLDAFIG